MICEFLLIDLRFPVFLSYPSSAFGKDVLLELIRRLFGSENCCHIDAHKMGGKFGISQLAEKRINPGLESNGKLDSSDIATIKTLSGDSVMSVERKHKDWEDFPNYCKMIFASNESIIITDSDTTDAFWDRCKLIHCGKSCAVEDRNPFLLDELWKERNLLMSMVVWEAKALIDNDFKFIEPRISSTIKGKWRYMNEDPIRTFLRERVEIYDTGNSFISTADLHKVFIQDSGSKSGDCIVYICFYYIWFKSKSM